MEPCPDASGVICTWVKCKRDDLVRADHLADIGQEPGLQRDRYRACIRGAGLDDGLAVHVADEGILDEGRLGADLDRRAPEKSR